MERVVTSPELLDIIFSLSDKSTMARSARVCKNWFDTSIRRLWCTLESLQIIFGILAPMCLIEINGNMKLMFNRILAESDWNRYYKYAYHVKKLKLNSKSRDMDLIIQEVSRSRTSRDLFPRLSKLRVAVEVNSFFADNIALFVSSNIRELAITVSDPNQTALTGNILSVVNDRNDDIKKLYIQGSIWIPLIEAQLNQFIQKQRNLEAVSIPTYANTSTIMSSLSLLPKLAVMLPTRILDSNGDEWEDLGNVLNFHPTLSSGAFPQLKEAFLHSRLQTVKNFFSMEHAPSSITNLHIRTLDLGSSSSGLLRQCLQLLADRCPSLKQLVLDFKGEITLTNERFITLDTLYPLHKLNLKCFVIIHPHPLSLNAQDIESIAHWWPRLNILRLNPEPLIWEMPSFDLSVLEVFAHNCPKLRKLELFTNIPETGLLQIPSKGFKHLNCISLGASYSSNWMLVGIYLGQICPPSCKLAFDIGWTNSITARVDPAYAARRITERNAWAVINTLFEAVKMLVNRGRREVQDLKDQNAVLRAVLQRKN